jgi:hypothetical protein
VFERLRHKHEAHHVLLYAFDLLELDGEDLRREPFETRKATLTSLVRGCLSGLRLNEHLSQSGDLVFRHACKLGARRDRLEAARLALSVRPVAGLAQNEEPGGAGGEASRGGLGTVSDLLLRKASEAARAEAPDDYDLIGAEGLVIGRIFRATTAPAEMSWM